MATTENWGLRTLAYPVKKNRKAHYVMFQLECDGKVVNELERNYRIQEDVIRFITIAIEALSTEPSIMMTPEDDSRDAPRSFDRDSRDRDSRDSRDSRCSRDNRDRAA